MVSITDLPTLSCPRPPSSITRKTAVQTDLVPVHSGIEINKPRVDYGRFGHGVFGKTSGDECVSLRRVELTLPLQHRGIYTKSNILELLNGNVQYFDL